MFRKVLPSTGEKSARNKGGANGEREKGMVLRVKDPEALRSLQHALLSANTAADVVNSSLAALGWIIDKKREGKRIIATKQSLSDDEQELVVN